MAKKGLDTTFVHYGIRKEDMGLIEALCECRPAKRGIADQKSYGDCTGYGEEVQEDKGEAFDMKMYGFKIQHWTSSPW